jgi:hypothetical protein
MDTLLLDTSQKLQKSRQTRQTVRSEVHPKIKRKKRDDGIAVFKDTGNLISAASDVEATIFVFYV